MTRDAERRSFVYDAENKQRRVYQNGQLVGEYYYDGDGRRVKKRVYAGGVLLEETVFVYDAFGKLVAEYSMQVESVERARVNYLTQDNLGSPRINTDRDGRVVARHDYMPFGEEIFTAQRTVGLGYTADTVRQKFTGYERDSESALDFAQARMYNYRYGRFTVTDPIMLTIEQLLDPQQLNLYVYCRNNPLIFTDPVGKKIVFANKKAEKAFERYEKFLEKNKNEEGFSELIATVQTLRDSEVIYVITLSSDFREGVGGNLTTDGERVFVNIANKGDEVFSLNSRFAHELEHARQFDAGELAFIGDDKGQYRVHPSSYDIGDEVKAYKAQLIASTGLDFHGKEGVFLRNFKNAKTDEERANLIARKSENYRRILSRGFDTNPIFDSSSGYKIGQLVRPTKENGYFFGRIRTLIERKK